MNAARPLALAALLMLAPPARADEIWLTDYGLIQWEASRDAVAVLNLIGPNARGPATLRLFVEGLGAHALGGRGTYWGYWTAQDGEVGCSAGLADPMGTITPHWGRLRMVFLADAYPSPWVALLGECWEEPDFRLVAQPLTNLPQGEP